MLFCRENRENITLQAAKPYETQEKQKGGERHAEPSAAPGSRRFGGDYRNTAAKDRAGLTMTRDKKGEDDQ